MSDGAQDLECVVGELMRDIEALRAENARLHGQKEGWKGLQAGTSDIVKQLEAENARLKEGNLKLQAKAEAIYDDMLEAKHENKRIREALKTFSNMAQYIVAGTPDEAVCADVEFTAGDLRAARKAMGESE